jgi:hypothetical protein
MGGVVIDPIENGHQVMTRNGVAMLSQQKMAECRPEQISSQASSLNVAER